MERLKLVMNKLLRDEQAGFRKERSCTDHIATLRIILEQSLEWNSSIYTTFVDFEKAFGSVDTEMLWRLHVITTSLRSTSLLHRTPLTTAAVGSSLHEFSVNILTYIHLIKDIHFQ